ncbi:hypothetical protein HY772_10255 [Candidatus Woesearchaeota archaeon]|nr:hypothetical protein [Candidatus Woesearchaeota archaeon]
MNGKSLTLHIGIFVVMLSATYLLVRFGGLSPDLLRAVPALFFLYLGVMFVFGALKKRRTLK